MSTLSHHAGRRTSDSTGRCRSDPQVPAASRDPGVDFGEYVVRDPEQPGVYLLDGESLSPLASELIGTLYQHGWIVEFGWMDWSYGRRLASHPELVAKANLKTLRRLLTAHVRSGRFVSGHLLDTFESEGSTVILRRLQVLHDNGRVR